MLREEFGNEPYDVYGMQKALKRKKIPGHKKGQGLSTRRATSLKNQE
jgi:hypothetical protein